jgi:uncharacterized iron-regulated protein
VNWVLSKLTASLKDIAIDTLMIKRFRNFVLSAVTGFYPLTLVLLMMFSSVQAQKKTAYAIFTGKGKKTGIEQMIKKASRSDVIFFGELHNNAIAHWLQYEMVESLHKAKPLILGAEMFEADNQEALDKYLSGKIDAKGLDTMARLWPNYKTDYAPLVNFAKTNNLPFVATNVPRRYANLVFKKDFQALDTLSEKEKSWMAPLPIPYDPELPGYAGMKTMMGGSHPSETLPKAQALKDATMAHFIAARYVPGHLFIHFNGSYHSENYEGIIWYLQKLLPDARITTITTVSEINPLKPDPKNLGKADFIICTDENMTNTY